MAEVGLGVPLYHISSCWVKYFREMPRGSRKRKSKRERERVGDLAGVWSTASMRKGAWS